VAASRNTPTTLSGTQSGFSADPAAYHAWYETQRGAWIAKRELDLMLALLRPQRTQRLLDVGCGTGWFSSRFADIRLRVTGLDPDPAALRFARQRDGRIAFVEGWAEALPFGDGVFDHAASVTSLCFVADPAQALRELWRVSRRSVVLGLLHRRSLLWRAKHEQGGYHGARWDLLGEVRGWAKGLEPAPETRSGWAVFLPSGGPIAQRIEGILPRQLPLGGFMVVCLRRPHVQ
jgi:SAM-dependent methyltransferase